MAKKKDSVLADDVETTVPDVAEIVVTDEPALGADQFEAEPEPKPALEPASEPVTYVPFADQVTPRPVLHSRRSFTGRVWDVTSDLVDLGESGVVTRDYVQHPGAVAIFALNEDSQVYL